MRLSRAALPAAALAAITAIVASGGTLVAASPQRGAATSSTAPPDADHARLGAMCGTWDVELTIRPRPGGVALSAKAVSTIRPLFGGLFIEETIEGAMGGAPFTTMAWTGFNTATHEYEATRISSTNPARIAETGAYDETTRRLELKGDYRLGNDTWHQRTVIQQPSADAMTATSYLSFGAVPEWAGVEIKYTRRPSGE